MLHKKCFKVFYLSTTYYFLKKLRQLISAYYNYACLLYFDISKANIKYILGARSMYAVFNIHFPRWIQLHNKTWTLRNLYNLSHYKLLSLYITSDSYITILLVFICFTFICLRALYTSKPWRVLFMVWPIRKPNKRLSTFRRLCDWSTEWMQKLKLFTVEGRYVSGIQAIKNNRGSVAILPMYTICSW